MSEHGGDGAAFEAFEDYVVRQQAQARNADRMAEHMLAHPDHNPEILESGWLRCSDCGPEDGDLLEATITADDDITGFAERVASGELRSEHDHPGPGDPAYDGFRITEIWAICGVDPTDNQEGIAAVEGPGGTFPLIASDQARLEDLQRLMVVRGLGSGHVLKHFVLVDGTGAMKAALPETVPATALDADPEWRTYVTHVEAELVPKIEGSSMTISLVPTGKTDVKFAVELGLSIMYDKPILALVPKGAEVPRRLRQVADLVLEWDPDDADAHSAVGQQIATFAREVEAGLHS